MVTRRDRFGRNVSFAVYGQKFVVCRQFNLTVSDCFWKYGNVTVVFTVIVNLSLFDREKVRLYLSEYI